MTTKTIKILVIRNDKLGDFMLAWPAFSLLKSQYPEAEITALVPEYTALLAEQCEWIDKILIDTKTGSFYNDIVLLSKKIKARNYDFSISLFSEFSTSAALWLSGIPTRIGPATKLSQIFLNKTLRQKRSQSKKPESEYNIDLIKYYIKICGDQTTETVYPPYLTFDRQELKHLRNNLIQKHKIKANTVIIFIHPGTGGSASNLSLEQYAELANSISDKSNVYFVITAGPDELLIAKKLANLLNDNNHHVHLSDAGIIEFCKYIAISDLFISGSTGPLHIAGALNICTTAFYPAKKSATSLRWQTLNSAENRLAISPATHTDENVMMQINAKDSANEIIKYFHL